MSLEDRLRDLRPRVPADGLRAKVLAAARGARREQRLWRWTWAVAAAVLAVAIPLNLHLAQPAAPGPARAANPPFEGLSAGGLPWGRPLAAAKGPGPVLTKEIP